MKNRFNYKIYFGIFLTIVIVFFITIFLYEGVKMGTSDYGSFGNSVILNLADLFQFPFNKIVKSSTDIVYFLGILINIAIYTMIICLISRLLLRRARKE